MMVTEMLALLITLQHSFNLIPLVFFGNVLGEINYVTCDRIDFLQAGRWSVRSFSEEA